MKSLFAFFSIIRWANLLFIALTQFLFFYCVLNTNFLRLSIQPIFNTTYLALFCLSSVLIAGAGNIINDYFDYNIDMINKPQKMVIGKYIHRHWAMALHIICSIVGIAIGFYLDIVAHTHLLGLTNFLCVILLFLYSIYFKKQAFTGNILVSLLTAWTLISITFAESINILQHLSNEEITKIMRITILYASFAFIISLIREMIKDIEDYEGDKKYHCKTIPILLGRDIAKIFVYIGLAILIVLLGIVNIYILSFQWFVAIGYLLLSVVTPLIYIFCLLPKAHQPRDFHKISSYIKMVMLAGILSMLFFLYY